MVIHLFVQLYPTNSFGLSIRSWHDGLDHLDEFVHAELSPMKVSFLLLVKMPGATNSVLALSSKARSP